MRLSAAAIVCMLTGGPVFAMSEQDCAAAWAAADKNSDGIITAEEGARYFAAIGAGDKSLVHGKLSQGHFMTHCQAGLFDPRPGEASMPRPGANSFTERQARERVLARGYRNVSRLKLDEDGVWRGTAELNAIKVNVAVDYKGNVVSKYP